jgi:hypothetical protein
MFILQFDPNGKSMRWVWFMEKPETIVKCLKLSILATILLRLLLFQPMMALFIFAVGGPIIFFAV